ncbi:NrtR DNA-binding winged helix domain-containing protein [Pedobacter westerhofensis]|uniref:NrtR DNA-binding winged helix domain-containing protein n=1 Tax=Pedobacter westerhofensis TaxID=425512 RepID=UPI0037421D3C
MPGPERANFYRKILNLEILENSGIKRKDTTYKPPVLYSFNQNYFKKTEEGFKNAF